MFLSRELLSSMDSNLEGILDVDYLFAMRCCRSWMEISRWRWRKHRRTSKEGPRCSKDVNSRR